MWLPIIAVALTILAVIVAFAFGIFLGERRSRPQPPVNVIANKVVEEVEVHERDEDTGEEFTYEDPFIVASHFREYAPERNIDQDD